MEDYFGPRPQSSDRQSKKISNFSQIGLRTIVTSVIQFDLTSGRTLPVAFRHSRESDVSRFEWPVNFFKRSLACQFFMDGAVRLVRRRRPD